MHCDWKDLSCFGQASCAGPSVAAPESQGSKADLGHHPAP